MLNVVVVGAGPAGNGVALELAKAGHEVAVVDYRTFLGDKLCTGIVSVSCLEQFPATKSVVHRSARSATLVSPAGKPLRFEREQPQAHIIDRVAYVADLAAQAETAGATYLLGRSVTDLRHVRRGVEVMLDGSGQPQRLEARMAVIATGFSRLLTGRMGLGKIEDYAIGAQVEVLAPAVEEVQVYLGRAFAPGFFGWLTPTTEGRALLGLLSRRNAQAGLSLLLASLERSGAVIDVIDAPKRWGVPLRPLRRTVADRILVVGDAAGQVKPTTGGGIYYALLASRIAARAISKALGRGDVSEASLRSYETEWSALLSHELAVGSRLRAIGERLSDRQIERVLSAVGSNTFIKGLLNSVDASFDWHANLAQRLMGRFGADFINLLGMPSLWRRITRAVT